MLNFIGKIIKAEILNQLVFLIEKRSTMLLLHMWRPTWRQEFKISCLSSRIATASIFYSIFVNFNIQSNEKKTLTWFIILNAYSIWKSRTTPVDMFFIWYFVIFSFILIFHYFRKCWHENDVQKEYLWHPLLNV